MSDQNPTGKLTPLRPGVEMLRVIRENPALREMFRRRGCEICDLAQTEPEAYLFVEEEVIAPTMTQQGVAEALRARWGVEVTQSQVSNHKTRHVDPAIAEYREQAIAHRAALSVLGTIKPGEQAVVAAQLALMDAQKRLEALPETGDEKAAGILQGSIAKLSAFLDKSERTPLELQQLEAIVREKEALAAQAEERVEELAVEWLRENAPEVYARFAAQAEEEGAAGDGS